MPRSSRARKAGLAVAAAMVWTSGAAADDIGYRSYEKAGTYEDVREDVKDAIIKRGYVIDFTGHFSDMLERTADAAGRSAETGRKSPYRSAEYMQFCPSKLTHEAVAANPLAIANCPITVFVYELHQEPGKIHVGYRLPVASPSKLSREINERFAALLQDIATEATKK